MSKLRPTVLFIHGNWHTPAHFAPVRYVFQQAGYPISCPALSNTQSDISLGLFEDARVIEDELTRLIEEEGKDVVVIGHSYGGVIATQAGKQKFSKKERQKNGKAGGILRLMYMCAFLVAEGESLLNGMGIRDGEPMPPFLTVDENGLFTVTDPTRLFYNDLSPPKQEYWAARLIPNAAHIPATHITHAAYPYHEITYLYCENDQALLLQIQKQMVEKVRGLGIKVDEEICTAGHSPYLSMPERVLEVVQKIC